MKSRLSAETKNRIQKSFADNPVYLLIRPTAQEYQQHPGRIKLSAEEIFAECFRILDRIKSSPGSAPDICSCIFDDSYSDLLALCPEEGESELRNGSSLISLAVAMCLNAANRDELFIKTTGPVMAKDTTWDGISRSYSARIPNCGPTLAEFLADYMASERKISEEIKRFPASREIDSEQLKHYFKPSFRGIGKGNIIDFYPSLVEKLKTERNAKDFAFIAKMIYDSPHHANRQNTFSKWHRTFCNIVGCPYVKYKPNQLAQPSEALKEEFSSLL